MPFAPQIRKQIVQAINLHILPLLRNKKITQFLAQPPYDFNQIEHWPLQKKPLQDSTTSPIDQIIYWPRSYVLASHLQHLGFVYSGASDERVGITNAMAAKLKAEGQAVPPGVIAYRLLAPATFYVPSLVPRHNGQHPYDESELARFGPVRMLSLEFNSRELFIRLYEQDRGGTHPLHIPLSPFPGMLRQYVEQLQFRQINQAQVTLMRLMQNLGDYLPRTQLNIGNSCWLPLSAETEAIEAASSETAAHLCREAIDYIHLHLHSPFTLQELAHVCGVNSAYLNRVFQRTLGITLMRYVTQSRINAAKLMLVEGDERISDIAHLLGFSSSNSFSMVFLRQVGIGPRDYRKTHRKKA
jgi:AraC-like DNA-binding protein